MTPRVKVCGITRLEDAETAVQLGAAAIGFIFWPRSPRYVEPARARAIVSRLGPSITAVGVFVDESADAIGRIALDVGIGLVQLHGDEDVADYAALPMPLLKAVPVEAGVVPEAARTLPAEVTVLLDAHDPLRRGGTGRTVDWTAAATVARQRRVFLSGGLTAANVAAAVAAVRPYAVDVSSGVEQAPGIKDAARMRDFFAALRTATPTA